MNDGNDQCRRRSKTRLAEQSSSTYGATTTRLVMKNQHDIAHQHCEDGFFSASTTIPLPTLPPSSRSLDDFLTRACDESSHHHNNSNNNNKRRPWRFWLVFISLGVANSSDASEILCLSYILSEPSFRLHILKDTPWRGGVLAAAVFFGMLVGGLLVGALGDKYGRRPMLLLGLATNCFSGILSALATNVWMLSLLRLVAGIGIGATVPPLFTLCSELAPPAHRGFWVTVAAGFWMWGSIYVACTAWILLGFTQQHDDDNTNSSAWRVFAVVCAVPSAVGCALVWNCVPESPRFLALKGRHDEAVVVINRVASALNYSGPLMTRSEVEEHYPTTTIIMNESEHYAEEGEEDEEEEVIVVPSTIMSSLQQQRRIRDSAGAFAFLSLWWHAFLASASQLYTSPQLVRTTLSLQTVWFSLSFGSYGLLTWINTLFEKVHLKNVYFNALLFSLANLPGNLLSAHLMDRVGRKRLLVGSVLASAASLIVFAYYAAETDNDNADADENDNNKLVASRSWIVLAACSFQCFSISAWNSIDVLTSELFPTTVRATGLGLCTASGRIGAMIAQFVNGSLVSQPVRLLLVAAATLLMGAVTPVCLPNDQTGQAVQDRVVGIRNTTMATTRQRKRRQSNYSLGGLSLHDLDGHDDDNDEEEDEDAEQAASDTNSIPTSMNPNHPYTYQPVDR